MEWQDVRVEKRGAAVWITLARPRELNAMSLVMTRELDAVLGEVEVDDEVRCVVVTGEGRAFCAGADLKFLNALPEATRSDATFAFLARATALMSRLEAFPKPVVAAVNGIATAGGMELLLCCDLVIAAESARFGDGHANFGLLPGAGASVRLPRKIGPNRAKYLFFTGDLLSAGELMEAGLVNRVVPDAQLVAAVDALATKLSMKSPLGLRRIKQLANDAFEIPCAEALRHELAANADYAHSFDRNEGLAAFSERRTPIFLGC